MQSIKFYIENYTNYIKYGLFILAIILMIGSIRTYINYLNIQTSIETVREETQQIEEQKRYEEKFVIPYEQTYLAEYFLAHENNILLEGEYIIRFDIGAPNIQTQDRQEETSTQTTPQQARKEFINDL